MVLQWYIDIFTSLKILSKFFDPTLKRKVFHIHSKLSLIIIKVLNVYWHLLLHLHHELNLQIQFTICITYFIFWAPSNWRFDYSLSESISGYINNVNKDSLLAIDLFILYLVVGIPFLYVFAYLCACVITMYRLARFLDFLELTHVTGLLLLMEIEDREL